MKLAKHKDFESFLADISPMEQIISLRLRELISTHFPELREKFGYGVPYYHLNTRVCFLYPASLPYSGIETGVSFGLCRAHLLSNEQGLLHMENRKEVGYVFLQRESDIEEELLLEILHEAVLLDQEMAAQKKR